MLTRLLLSTILVCLALTAYAQEDEEPTEGEFSSGAGAPAPNADSDSVPGLGLEAPSYGGSGCPQGSASSTLSPDQRTLTVLFDNYVVQAGAASGVRRAEGGCQIRIPFNVPPGFRVQIVKMDYRGFANLPAGGHATFAAGFRYLKARRPNAPVIRFKRAARLAGPFTENFQLSSLIRGPKWSPCGQAFTLATDSILTVQSNGAGEESMSSVDSLDAMQMPVRLSLRWKRCDGKDEREDRGHPGRDRFDRRR